MPVYRNLLCITLALLGLFAGVDGFAESPQHLEILSHYQFPPYVNAKSEGLSYDLAQYLNQHSGGRIVFAVTLLPKKRLLSRVSQTSWHGVVPWVQPEWMKRAEQARFLWSETLIEARDKVVSLVSAPLEWPVPFDGGPALRFGAVLGHDYDDLEYSFKRARLLREDAPDLESNINKLRKQRIDFLFVLDLSLKYFAQRDAEFLEKLYISKSDRHSQSYHLKLMFDLGIDKDNRWLAALVQKMPQDKSWQMILARYGLVN